MKSATVAELTALLRRAPDNPRVVVTGNHVPPWTLLGIVDSTYETYRLTMLNAPRGIPVREGIVHETSFVGPGMRGLPSLAYTPARLSLVPTLFRSTQRPDVVAVHVSAPIDGRVSLGMEINVMVAAIEAVKDRGGILVAQVNSKMPYTYGDGELSLDIFDAVIEADEELLASTGPAPVDDVTTHIGELVSARVGNGATLQLGIGAVPDATMPGLARRSGLGIWTEMFSDGVLDLERREGAGDLVEALLVTLEGLQGLVGAGQDRAGVLEDDASTGDIEGDDAHRLAHRDHGVAGLLGHPLGRAVAGARLAGLDARVGHELGRGAHDARDLAVDDDRADRHLVGRPLRGRCGREREGVGAAADGDQRQGSRREALEGRADPPSAVRLRGVTGAHVSRGPGAPRRRVR